MEHTPMPWIIKGQDIYICTWSGRTANAKLIAAAPDLLEEHKEWANRFGTACILSLQGDYSAFDEIARNYIIEFHNGEPHLKSQAIAKATE